MRTILLLGALTFVLFGQKPPEPAESKPGEEKKPEVPLDQAALDAARKIEDPVKKLGELNAILAQFPKTELKENVYSEVFKATLKAYPQDRVKILRAANSYVKTTSKDSRKYSNANVAGSLLGEEILLAEAEEYARKAVAGHRPQSLKQATEKARKEKSKPPAEDELLFDYNYSRSYPLETLGLLTLKKGRVDEGRKLLEETLKWRSMAAGARVALAELEEKAGNEEKALDHLLVAKLSGRMPKHGTPLLERLYVKRHGSMSSLESTLDALYQKRFPSPLHVERYRTTTARSNRVVLAELFTGAGCPPCAAADLAFDAVLERYSRDEVAFVVYHQHIPQPDPMSFPATLKRFEFYKRGGVPTYLIDGEKDNGGGPRETAKAIYEKINPKIEACLTEKAGATIQLAATRSGEKIRVTASAEPIGGDKRDLRLHLVLVEQMLRYSGENGIRFHPMVVRSIASSESGQGFAVEMNKRLAVEHEFDISTAVKEIKEHLDDYEVNGRHGKIQFSKKMHEIDPGKLAIIAFVQDMGSAAILQSKFSQIRSQTASAQ